MVPVLCCRGGSAEWRTGTFFFRRAAWAVLLACAVCGVGSSAAQDDVAVAPHSIERLSASDQAMLRDLLQRAEPLVSLRKSDATINLLTFEELYAPLLPPQRAFLDWMRSLTPEQVGGVRVPLGSAPSSSGVRFERVEPQVYTDKNGKHPLDPQYLPAPVLAAYRRMTDAMEREIGRRLFVDSGYRAPAYQLYLFCFYLPNHDMSIRETNRHVALPGFSEHGAPQRQAIDFINADGINGDGQPEAFEALPEYRWLEEHAGEHGFVLSYPRDNALATSFEPWHWHYEGR